MTALSLPPAKLFDDRPCDLGEGAFWHPTRKQLFWFDITSDRLLSQDAAGPREWRFDGPVSAAGWIDEHTLLLAGPGALLRFDIASGRSEPLADLDCDGGRLRPNDGRADPWGGFWIGTMGWAAEPQAGAIWRWHRGRICQLFDRITIPNAICFAPDATHAFFTDTPNRIVFRQRLDNAGWPRGEPEPWLDLRDPGLNPDGAVIDAAGRLWLAEWGAGRVAVHCPEGRFLGAVEVGAPHSSCPAFGGTDLSILYVTTACQGMDATALAATPQAGMSFAADLGAQDVRGQAEHQILL